MCGNPHKYFNAKTRQETIDLDGDEFNAYLLRRGHHGRYPRYTVTCSLQNLSEQSSTIST